MGKAYHANWYKNNKVKHDERNAAWHKSNPEKAKANSRKSYLKRRGALLASLLEKKYGITISEYDAMNKLQNGVCAICKKPCTCGRRLAVDHDHDTGIVRELLCSRCNRGIGMFKESPDYMKSAFDYLIKHKNLTKSA